MLVILNFPQIARVAHIVACVVALTDTIEAAVTVVVTTKMITMSSICLHPEMNKTLLAFVMLQVLQSILVMIDLPITCQHPIKIPQVLQCILAM